MAKTLVITESLEKILREGLSDPDGATLTHQEGKILLQELDAWRNKAEQFRKSEKKLSEAYLRIRTLVNAFNTPEAPTAEQVYAHTEDKIRELKEKYELVSSQLRLIEG